MVRKGRNRQPRQSSTGVQTYSVKDQIVNMLEFVGYTISAITVQLCHSNVKAVIDNV